LKVAGSTLEAAAANGTLAAATGTVTANVGKARTQFIDMAVKMGMNTAAAGRLADGAGLTSGRVKDLTSQLVALGKQRPTPVANANITPAQAKVNQLKAEIKAIKGSNPQMDVDKRMAEAKIRALQQQIDNVTGKTVQMFVTTTNSLINLPPTTGPIKRAGGGPVNAGQPYIVGEIRPELFVPNVAGTIVPRVPSFAGAVSAPSGSAGGVNVAAPQVHVYVDGQEFKGLVRVELAADAKARTTWQRQRVGA
jgi:hypothetical protein